MAKKEDWKINVKVKETLVRKWIDVSKLRINTIKGNVDIRGKLAFTGKAKDDYTTPIIIINALKQLDQTLKAIPGVKTIKYSFEGWKKMGGKWTQTEKAKTEEG